MMTKVKSKKLVHKLSYIKYENEEVEDLMTDYTTKFYKDFAEELEFLKSIDALEIKDSQVVAELDQIKDEAFHDLFKLIARQTHPDLHGEEYVDLFKRANSSYKERKWEELLEVAAELGVRNIEFSEEEITLIEERIKEISDKLDHLRNHSVIWIWNTSPVERDKLKPYIAECLGVDPEEFEKFKQRKTNEG
jgi:hypothetical protein